jgi:hypothetical protein
MIENDFPALRSAVRDSAIGRATASVLSSFSSAAFTASATALIASGLASFRRLMAPEKTRMIATSLAIASVASWALALFVPPYLSMAIPGSAFLWMGLVFAAAAAGANWLSEQWSQSRLRRFSAWLRGV